MASADEQHARSLSETGWEASIKLGFSRRNERTVLAEKRQYGPLTVLVLDALRFRFHDRYIYVWALAVVALIGVGDEFLQGLFPDRRFDLHDVILNSLAAALTLAWVGWVQGEENYPWGSKSARFNIQGSK